MKSTSVFLFVFLLYLSHFKCDSRDIITSRNILSNKRKTLVSAGQIFELGLFNTRTKDGELRNYVGIWYRVSPKTIVWVANRDKPIPLSHDILAIGIDVDGNLKVLDSTSNSYFSTGLVSASSSKRTAKLYDSGNLVLIDDLSGKRLWQSFDNPTDTFLPGMNMDSALKLTAWRVTQKDPSTGDYTFRQCRASKFEYNILSQNTVLRWKGSISAKPFSFIRELPSLVGSMLTNFSLNTKQQNTPILNNSRTDDVSSVPDFNYTRIVMNSSGDIQLYGWCNESTGWLHIWSEPQGSCNTYDTCGKFGICNSGFMSRCKCLPGFNPDSPDEWTVGTYTDGCSRKSVRGCNKKSEFDTFLNMHFMKFEEPEMPDVEAKSEEDCRKGCLRNCKCLAYSYFEQPRAERETSSMGTVPSCSIWTKDLNNLQENYTGGLNLSVRIAITDIGAITRRNCKPCGSNIIPYPLSSQPNCGDPLYYSFSCDDLTGEARFRTLKGSYLFF